MFPIPPLHRSQSLPAAPSWVDSNCKVSLRLSQLEPIAKTATPQQSKLSANTDSRAPQNNSHLGFGLSEIKQQPAPLSNHNMFQIQLQDKTKNVTVQTLERLGTILLALSDNATSHGDARQALQHLDFAILTNKDFKAITYPYACQAEQKSAFKALMTTPEAAFRHLRTAALFDNPTLEKAAKTAILNHIYQMVTQGEGGCFNEINTVMAQAKDCALLSIQDIQAMLVIAYVNPTAFNTHDTNTLLTEFSKNADHKKLPGLPTSVEPRAVECININALELCLEHKNQPGLDFIKALPHGQVFPQILKQYTNTALGLALTQSPTVFKGFLESAAKALGPDDFKTFVDKILIKAGMPLINPSNAQHLLTVRPLLKHDSTLLTTLVVNTLEHNDTSALKSVLDLKFASGLANQDMAMTVFDTVVDKECINAIPILIAKDIKPSARHLDTALASGSNAFIKSLISEGCL